MSAILHPADCSIPCLNGNCDGEKCHCSFGWTGDFCDEGMSPVPVCIGSVRLLAIPDLYIVWSKIVTESTISSV